MPLSPTGWPHQVKPRNQVSTLAPRPQEARAQEKESLTDAKARRSACAPSGADEARVALGHCKLPKNRKKYFGGILFCGDQVSLIPPLSQCNQGQD